MQQISAYFPIIDLIVIGIGGAVVAYLVRIEHRLTKIETKLEVVK